MRKQILLTVVSIFLATLGSSAQEFSQADAHSWLRVQEALDGSKGRYTQKELELRYGKKATYSLQELKDLDKSPFSGADFTKTEEKAEAEIDKVFKGVKIRETYSDVVASEDGSVTDPKEKLSQVKGASATFTRDLKNDNDTWAGRGAIALPFVYRSRNDGATAPMELMSIGLVPSVSIHKVASEDPSVSEIDSLIYRAGVFGSFAGLHDPDAGDLIFRGALAYATDTDHEAQAWAGEFDIEPRLQFAPRLAVGTKKWIPKAGKENSLFETDKNGKIKAKQDWALLNYELRSWIHGEFGTIDDAGDASGVDEGDFFRAGPSIDLMVNFPSISPLTLNAKYRYLASLDGDTDDSSLFEASAEWTLWQDFEAGQRVTAKISYLNGGLDLTAEEAETILIGMGITL